MTETTPPKDTLPKDTPRTNAPLSPPKTPPPKTPPPKTPPAKTRPTLRSVDAALALLSDRLAAIDWGAADAELDAIGVARLGPVLEPETCRALSATYDDDARFRRRIDMARHGFGAGEYKYFADPAPPVVEALRREVFPHAARTANRWAARLNLPDRFPETLAEMRARCAAAGQTKPTPLLLRYGPGDYNRLHQDLYGPHVFPLQMVVLLSDPAAFEGGEFVLVEGVARMQSRAEVVPLAQGEAALFATHERPRLGKRGYARAKLRHGVSRVRAGRRETLGIIFHDAA